MIGLRSTMGTAESAGAGRGAAMRPALVPAASESNPSITSSISGTAYPYTVAVIPPERL